MQGEVGQTPAYYDVIPSLRSVLRRLDRFLGNRLDNAQHGKGDTEKESSPKVPVLVHLIQNYSRDPITGEEGWTTGVLPNGDPQCYHWRLPQLAATLKWNIGGKDGH